MTVFKYINKKDNTLIGYHLSSFCQTGKLLENAKRYDCETSEDIQSQLEVIQKNFNLVINSKPLEENSTKFFDLNPIRERYFNGLTQEDVEIQYEKVPCTEIEIRVHTVVDENGIHKV